MPQYNEECLIYSQGSVGSFRTYMAEFEASSTNMTANIELSMIRNNPTRIKSRMYFKFSLRLKGSLIVETTSRLRQTDRSISLYNEKWYPKLKLRLRIPAMSVFEKEVQVLPPNKTLLDQESGVTNMLAIHGTQTREQKSASKQLRKPKPIA